jgi:phosphatidylserine/phosphatidylglycerophosphate/cardiolipin synthase-like enzyme
MDRHSSLKRKATNLIWYSIPAALVVYVAFMLLTSLHADQFKATGTIDVYFSPDGGATRALVREIDNARSEVLIQGYSFTSAPIAKAVVHAHKRGLKIEVVLDRSQRTQKYSSADFFAHSGVSTYIDSAHAIAHNKIMIIDGETLATGSFNFTRAAEEKNAENLLIMKGNKPLAERYIKNFREHKAHSERYHGR